jgi:medium-chain acyl-[acyl-carrier-protein] hydrolase
VNQPKSDTDNWFVCPQTNLGAEMRLFLFPYAGGGPAAFWKWSSELPSHIETWIAHYPGRGSRYNKAPAKKMFGLVGGIFHAISSLLDKPFAFFGHSLGGLVAYELAQSLHKNNLQRPIALFVSACSAPQLPDTNPPIHRLPDPEFVSALQELNGIPEEVANQPELLELLLPTLRADFEIAENYQYNPSEQLLICPIVALGGIDDPRVSRERLEGWTSQTSSSFTSIYFPGDHFYLNTAKGEIIESITREMKFSLSAKRKSG